MDGVLRSRREDESFADRGVATSTMGDGAHVVLVDRETSATVVFIAF